MGEVNGKKQKCEKKKLQPKNEASFLEIQLPLNDFEHKALLYYFLCTFDENVIFLPLTKLLLCFMLMGNPFLLPNGVIKLIAYSH